MLLDVFECSQIELTRSPSGPLTLAANGQLHLQTSNFKLQTYYTICMQLAPLT